MNTTMNTTRLRKEDVAAKIAEMKRQNRKDKKFQMSRLLIECDITAEQLDAWICMRDYLSWKDDKTITVPLSDIWQEELPGKEETTVTLKYFKKDSTHYYYYIALNHDGNVYDAEVEELSLPTPMGFYLAEIDGLPAEYTMQSLALHSALVQLLTEAGIYDDEYKCIE